MNLEAFYSSDDERIVFSRTQASAFAKEIADDFNPLHDPEAKLFCVPGDLLFAVALARYGLSTRMRFLFSGMVDGGTPLDFPNTPSREVSITDGSGRACLQLESSGETSHDKELIKALTHTYVEFSGHTFPDILVPLMSSHGVMINPARPLVIYESMEIRLDNLNLQSPVLEYTGATLDSNGKKGHVSLNFLFKEGGETVGKGAKYMLLRGLKPYDKMVVDDAVAGYMAHKAEYKARREALESPDPHR